MNYSDLMDQMAGRATQRNCVKVSFNVDGNPGEVKIAALAYRIVSKDMDGTTIEILELKRENTPEPSRIVPSPS